MEHVVLLWLQAFLWCRDHGIGCMAITLCTPLTLVHNSCLCLHHAINGRSFASQNGIEQTIDMLKLPRDVLLHAPCEPWHNRCQNLICNSHHQRPALTLPDQSSTRIWKLQEEEKEKEGTKVVVIVTPISPLLMNIAPDIPSVTSHHYVQVSSQNEHCKPDLQIKYFPLMYNWNPITMVYLLALKCSLTTTKRLFSYPKYDSI